jgi:ribosome maturation factor RimP
MISSAEVEKAIHRRLEGTGKFLVEIRVTPKNVISVFIDGDQGITIDDCRDLTRFIESVFDRTKKDYELSVSSAGADRPMKNPRQFPKHLGRKLVVATTDGATISGRLVSATADAIELEMIPGKKELQKPNITIPFAQINEARITLMFK